jgi:hypothetical protein
MTAPCPPPPIAGFACNVIAGVHHDQLFVPVASAVDPMAPLQPCKPDPPGEHATRLLY